MLMNITMILCYGNVDIKERVVLESCKHRIMLYGTRCLSCFLKILLFFPNTLDGFDDAYKSYTDHLLIPVLDVLITDNNEKFFQILCSNDYC